MFVIILVDSKEERIYLLDKYLISIIGFHIRQKD